jgi:hypothetical protein
MSIGKVALNNKNVSHLIGSFNFDKRAGGVHEQRGFPEPLPGGW